jgi:hypothetical protein
MRKIAALALVAPLALAGGLGLAGPASAAPATGHLAWCEQHYRSYNPATDTFTGYDGRAYACISPAVGTTRTFGLAPLPRILQQQSASGHDYNVFPNERDPNYGNPFGG